MLRSIQFLQIRTMHLLREKAFVNNKWVDSITKKTFPVTNPATGKIVGLVPDMNVEDTQNAIENAYKAFQFWGNTTAKQRSILLRKWYNLMVENSENLAKIITLESGKPLIESRGEVAYGNSFIEFYSEESTRLHGEIVPASLPNRKMLIEKHPIGVAGLITPWNFPHAMITRKAGAALAAGCTCVIKPAEDTPLTALALMELAEKAGFPDGVLNVVTSSRPNAPAIGKLLCTSPLVAGISFTGSTQVGKLLYNECSNGIKRIGLELGGNAPFIVYESANLDHALKGAITSKFRNCGQACIASNRFLIQEKIWETFVNKLIKEIENLKIGDGTDDGIHLGPLINEAQYKKIVNFVNDAVSKGAKILFGGKALPELGGLFYQPTVITDITPNMLLYKEEVFGPIVALYRFNSEADSIKIANETERGLAGYFYSQDLHQILRVARKLEVGMVGVNEGMVSAAEAPFGGIKESGIGREGGKWGMEEFLYVKYINLGNLNI